MGEVINLNRARKRRQQADKQKQAALNRKKFGRGKGEKRSETLTRDSDERKLDAHRIEDQE